LGQRQIGIGGAGEGNRLALALDKRRIAPRPHRLDDDIAFMRRGTEIQIVLASEPPERPNDTELPQHPEQPILIRAQTVHKHSPEFSGTSPSPHAPGL
jgi:hypothetical protein